MSDQQEMLEKILSCISHSPDAGADIEIEEISNEAARDRIVALFGESGASPLFYDDISDRLGIPLRQAVEVCNQLESEGLIGEPAGK